MATFHMEWDDVAFDRTGAETWIMFVWAVENESRMWGGNIRRTTSGYIKQETQRILAERGLKI